LSLNYLYSKEFNILKDENMQLGINRSIGFILLAIYLILIGISAIAPGILTIPSIALGILALVSGVLILIGV
jgi:hypothetical protein